MYGECDIMFSALYTIALMTTAKFKSTNWQNQDNTTEGSAIIAKSLQYQYQEWKE